MSRWILFSLSSLFYAQLSLAENFNIAVAANFKEALQRIEQPFYQKSAVRFQTSSGSSGVLYAQILAGAPFDIFLSADDIRPEVLIDRGIAKEIYTYAIGKLVLWVPKPKSPVNMNFLKSYKGRLAIANPVTAPYGKAARGLLDYLGLANEISVVKGNSIAQAYQFVESTNVDAGLIAYSLVKDKCFPEINCWMVPQEYYPPILQKAVLLSDANKGAVEFFSYLKSAKAKHIISEMGYRFEDEL